MKMPYVVLIKNLRNEVISEGPIFKTKKKAQKWAEEQMSVFIEEFAYKVAKMRKPEFNP